jgi:hypothetical protein
MTAVVVVLVALVVVADAWAWSALRARDTRQAGDPSAHRIDGLGHAGLMIGAGLELVEVGVVAAAADELFVRPLLDEPAVS